MVEGVSELKAQDARRRQAMIDADSAVLTQVLDEGLSWTHSSGVLEDKSEFIAAIQSGNVVYEMLDINADSVHEIGDVYIHTGQLSGRATREGQVKTLKARFLSVWRRTEHGLKMLAWQTTNTS